MINNRQATKLRDSLIGVLSARRGASRHDAEDAAQAVIAEALAQSNRGAAPWPSQAQFERLARQAYDLERTRTDQQAPRAHRRHELNQAESAPDAGSNTAATLEMVRRGGSTRLPDEGPTHCPHCGAHVWAVHLAWSGQRTHYALPGGRIGVSESVPWVQYQALGTDRAPGATGGALPSGRRHQCAPAAIAAKSARKAAKARERSRSGTRDAHGKAAAKRRAAERAKTRLQRLGNKNALRAK